MLPITHSAVAREEVWRAFRRTHDVRLREQYYFRFRNSSICVGLAVCYRGLGLMDEYYRQIAIARELVVKERDYDCACLAAICGEHDDALMLLREALEKKEIPLAWAERDPDFDSLRADPRFAALIEEIRECFAN
jgi:hypothetical protein